MDMEIRVYYEDTDSGGVVYHSNYVNFAERARTELLRSLGFENKSLLESRGIAFVVRHIEADYLKPAYLDDLLTVKSSVLSMKNSSMVLKQDVFRNSDLICAMKVTIVCLEMSKFTPVRLPDDLKNEFQKHLSES